MANYIKIIVEGGCVTDVEGLPAGWQYEIEDHDVGDDDDEGEGEHVCDDDCRANGCGRVQVDYSELDDDHGGDDATTVMLLNYYHCPKCGEGWTDEWDCACDDECPGCGLKGVSPYDSEEI